MGCRFLVGYRLRAKNRLLLAVRLQVVIELGTSQVSIRILERLATAAGEAVESALERDRTELRLIVDGLSTECFRNSFAMMVARNAVPPCFCPPAVLTEPCPGA